MVPPLTNTFSGSDLDFFVHLQHPVGKTKATDFLRKLAESMKGRTRGKQKLYQDVVTMCNGRVPVLKCRHMALNREININFTSHTGVNNSYMLKHLVSMDTRIRPLMVLLKIYFKVKLTPNQLTTFNLYSLIIIALQNTDDPVLPPLSTFLDPSKSNVLAENRWPVQFLCKPFETKNRQTVIELILHFCSFYAEFDFANRLVSPYMGNRPVTKDNYDTFKEFACSDQELKFNRAINIQDFFVLCVNLGSDCRAFQDLCRMHHKHRKEYEALADDSELSTAFFEREEDED